TAVVMEPFLGRKVIDIEAGGDHSLALTEDGRVYAWGDNYYGAIGDRTNIDRFIPVPVYYEDVLYTKITQISAGVWHSVALSEDGRVFVWGYNGYGTLGLAHSTNMNKPQEVDLNARGITNVTQIQAARLNTIL